MTTTDHESLTSVPTLDGDSSSSEVIHHGNETALEKASTAHSNRSTIENRAHSVLSRARSREPGQTAPFTHPLDYAKTTEDVIVDFDGPQDPYKPLNWGFVKKAVTTVMYGSTTMGTTFASSVYSPGIAGVQQRFGLPKEVATLGTALLLFGMGIGPLFWAPLSELSGRKTSVMGPYFLAAVFSFASAVSKDTQSLMITRFWTGFFGSAPVTCTGGVMSDIWSAEQRGAAMAVYSMSVVGGTVLGPIIGGAVSQSYLGWRWTEYLTGILMSFILCVDIIFLDESHHPTLLVNKARKLRLSSGNWALHARHEEWDVSFKELGNKYLIRPFVLLTTPICFLVAIYASFVYGILYLTLAVFPVAFSMVRGWNLLVSALPYIALFVGVIMGVAVNIVCQRFYIERLRANNYRPVPEARLIPMMIGSIFFAAGLFIFGWTSRPNVHWMATMVGIASMGLGFFTIFQAALNYLVDTFQKFSASAVAANTFLRSVLAGTFPLFARYMFLGLGMGWAGSLLGFISVAMIPIPYMFYVFGPRIRARGKWSKDSCQ